MRNPRHVTTFAALMALLAAVLAPGITTTPSAQAQDPQPDWVGEIGAFGEPSWTAAFNIGGLYPCARAEVTGQIVNNTDLPASITYTGSEATGTIAPFLVLGIENWEDVVLQPGERTGVFTFTVEMPCDTGNEAQGTSGQVHWNWQITPVEPPLPAEFEAVDDAAITSAGEPITIPVLDNDLNVPEGARVEVSPGDPAGGEWSVRDDGTVVFTPSDGFSGKAHATYTVFDAAGEPVGTAAITVDVAPPPDPEPPTTTQPPTTTSTEPPTTTDQPTSEPEPTTSSGTSPTGSSTQDAAPPTTTGTSDTAPLARTGPGAPIGALVIVSALALLAGLTARMLGRDRRS